MKSINTVRTSTVMVARWSRLKSRITSINSRLWTIITPMLFVAFGLFGVNESAWGQLPYNTTMTQTHYNDSKVKVGSDGESYSMNAWSGGIFLQAGTYKNLFGTIKGEELNWNDKYVIIALKTNSIPYQLKFKYKCNSIIATNPDWYVAESSDKSNWTTIWSTESNSTSTSALQTVDLSKSTKYIKFCYSGNYGGTYSDIKVTDQAYVHNPKVGDDEKSSLDFGSGTISSGKAELSFDVEWCNVSALSVTSSNPTFFTVSPSSFGNTAKYGTQTVTVYYDRDVAVGNNHSGTITISNGNSTYTKTVSVKGTTTKRPQEIHWNASLAAVNYTLNAEESLTGSAIATTDNEEAVITYTSSKSDVIAVSPDGKILSAVSTGTATITASATGSDIYAVGSDSKLFTVTAKKKQTITWNQNLMGLKTNANPKTVNLNATATSNGTITYSIEAGSDGCITLGGTNNSVMTITGTPGTAYVKATQVGGVIGGEEWIAATAIKQVKVRDPNSSCDEYAISDESFTFSSGDKTSMSEKVFNLTGKPTTLTFKAKRGGLKFLWSEQKDLYIEQYANFGSGLEWKQLQAIKPGESEGSYGPYALEETATKIRFRSGEYAEQQVYNITSARKTIFDVNEPSITDDAERNVKWSKTISVTRSNIDVLDISVTSADASCPFQLSKTSLGTDCADMSTETFEVFFTPTTKNKTYTGTITITDGKASNTHTATIPLSVKTVAFNQAITWNFTDNQEFPTTNVPLVFNATTDATGLEVSYRVAEEDADKATIDGNTLTIIGSGSIQVTAYQEGDDKYNEAPEITKTIIANKVTPNITNPTGKAIEYRSALKNSTWTAAGEAKVTLRGVPNTVLAGSFSWNDPEHVVMDAAGEHSYKATFTPSDGGMYNNVEYDQTITILRTAQTLEMKDGAVKVAVNGIDAGKADSKIDLDDLIKSQTGDVVNNVKRDGVVTYEVISENKANATIVEGNIFSARVIGDYRIRATKAQTDWYNEVTDEFTVTVSKRANTMTISNTAFERFVDQEVTNIRDVQNSDAEVQTSSDFPTIAYYDVANNKIVIPNSESDYQMFGSQKTVTIKIWQAETERFEASGEKTITLTVKKYETTKSGEDIVLKVNETKKGNYSFTNASADYPSNDLNDDFYYTIDQPSFDNEALNNGDQLITYNPSDNEITGHNAGTTKITFFQKETYKYTGATLMCNVTVEKRDNQLNNSWGNNVWQKAMNEGESQNVSFTSTHGDYANYPISIDRIYGEDVATLTGNAAGATITTNTTKGYAIWHVSQAENYEYYSAEADVIVTVGVPAPPTCYLYQDNSEHEFATGIGDAEGHFESPIAINSPVDKIWFNAKRQFGGVNKFVVQYSKDNGKSWSTLLSPSLDRNYNSSAFSATFPTLQGSERITNVRFGAKTGATLSKWYKDVQISRRAYLNLQDAEKNKISKLPTMMCTIDETSSATAKFYIDYSTCADEIIIESSNPEHFIVSESTIDVSDKHDNLTSAKKEITVTYNSTELGTHNAVITVHTSYQTRALSVSGETSKRTPELIWQEGYTNNPMTLPVGLTVDAIKPAAKSSNEASVRYESSNEEVVEITDNGYGFRVIKAGSAVLTAIVPANDNWKEVSDTRVIQATDKIVQEIVWNQTFPRFMEPGKDVIDLDAKVYLRNLSTNDLNYSPERTSFITYTCPTNNGVVSISGNQMTVLGYGEVKVTASVGGNTEYAAAASVIMLINVRQPSVGCETPLVLHTNENVIDMFEVNVDFSNYLNLTTQEMVSDELLLDSKEGKPDKLSFQYSGEVYKVPVIGTEYFGGFIKFEQHVNGNWIAVVNSRVETVKNEWKANSNLQLDENADALRIIREAGGTGYHYIKDIQVTRKQYLRETNSEINLGEIKIGQATPVTIGFEYSDVKGDLTARTINNTTDLTIKDNGVIDVECGSFGHYELQVTFTPTKAGEWQGTVEVYDPLTKLSFTVTLTATVTATEEYIFNVEGGGNWNVNTNWTTNLVPDEHANITVATDMIINSAASVKSITINEGVTVTVKSGVTLQVGDGTPKNQAQYGNLYVEDGGQVLLGEGAVVPVNNFSLAASIGGNGTPASSGQVGGDGDLNVSGEVYFQISFDPSGAISYGWYDFTVPFEVDVLNGVFDKDGNKLTYNVDYAVMDFSESKRAVNGKYWNWFSGTLKPNRLYSITFDDEKNWNTFLFKRKTDVHAFGSNVYGASFSNGEKTKDRGWNGMGNGTLRYCQLNNLPNQTKVLVYDHINDRYEERVAAEYTYAVGTAFFVQVNEEKNIDLTSVAEERDFLAPARERRSVEEFHLALTEDGKTNAADRLWVSASEEATGEYVIGHDLLKMGTPTAAKVAQMWTTMDDQKLCDIEMPLVADKATTDLSLYAPKAGQYTLEIEKAPEDATLYLMYKNNIVWNLSMSPFTFDLTKGTTEGFGLCLVADAPKVTTDIENDELLNGENGVRKVLIDNKVYIVTPEGKMYDIVGKSVKY